MALFHRSGHALLTPEDAFSPLLTLESMGYGWQIGKLGKGMAPYRYEPAEGEAVGAWLAPPEPGVRILTVKKADEGASDESG